MEKDTTISVLVFIIFIIESPGHRCAVANENESLIEKINLSSTNGFLGGVVYDRYETALSISGCCRVYNGER
jgi:hypothetical protein